MKTIQWVDDRGRTRRSMLPDKADPTQPEKGVDYGVDLRGLGLDDEYTVRLQNELRARGLWTADDMKRLGTRAASLVDAALRAANISDVTMVINEYLKEV